MSDENQVPQVSIHEQHAIVIYRLDDLKTDFAELKASIKQHLDKDDSRFEEQGRRITAAEKDIVGVKTQAGVIAALITAIPAAVKAIWETFHK